MSNNNDKYMIKELSFDVMIDELNKTSPLQMSKKLIEYELYDQKDSIEVLNQIYKDFDDKNNVIDSLVSPMLLNVADGLIKHPKLEGTFRKTNITPSVLVNDVNSFTYSEEFRKQFNGDFYLKQAEKSHYGKFLRNFFYDIKSRTLTRKDKGLTKNEISGKDMDHVNPINHIRKKYKNNPFLYRDDLAQIIGLKENEQYEDPKLNRSKGDKTWSEYIKNAPKDEKGNILDGKGKILLTVEGQVQKLKLEEESTKAQNKEATLLMAKNIGLVAFGDLIILILKPIWFEIKDMIQNGVISGFELQTNDKIEAFILRIKRAFNYIKLNVIPVLENNIKGVFENFIGVFLSSLIDSFKGIFQKIFQIICDGFIAIKEAFKIMMKPDISASQKADAITKIIASAVVPILVFAFEESIFGFLNGTPFDFLKDVASIILSGFATTLVIWFLDQIDIFSVKDEKRMMRIKEIFELRVETIKKNTDIFESASLETLAKQKLQFKKISENMNKAIKDKLNVNDSIYQMADFMQIDLKVKSTNDFLHLLNTNEKLVI